MRRVTVPFGSITNDSSGDFQMATLCLLIRMLSDMIGLATSGLHTAVMSTVWRARLSAGEEVSVSSRPAPLIGWSHSKCCCWSRPVNAASP